MGLATVRPRIELSLYVNPASVACLRVQGEIEAVLDRYDRDHILFEVLDIRQHIERAEQDRVLFTPTLVKRCPAPPAWLVGDAGGHLVGTLLASCGVKKTR